MLETSSFRNLVRSTPADRLKRAVNCLSPESQTILTYDWLGVVARDNQLPPQGDWYVWLIMAGRGWGKTRTGAEYVRWAVENGHAKRIALVAETAADARDVMVEGSSGLLAISPPWFRPTYEPSKRRVVWPNGAIATTYSGDSPDQLRGPQHDLAWCDEPAKWRYADEAWDNLELGLRIGNPRIVATTTPRPISLIRRLANDSRTIVTRGATWENAENLAPSTLKRLRELYEGTRFARQEIYGEIVEDVEGALWTWSMIEDHRAADVPPLVRVVVAVDPAATAGAESNETGIVVVGIDQHGHGYVLADYSRRDSPDGWARTVVSAYREWQCDRVVAEVNQGGDMVESVLRTVDASIAYEAVRATRGKYTRAEPVAALYEQGKIHHAQIFTELEQQMTTYVPGDTSPDRLDALVWGITALGLIGYAEPDIITSERKRVITVWDG